MKKNFKNLLFKIFLLHITLFLLPIATAQTWKTPNKNLALPIAVENSSCNSTADTAGIKNDHSTILTCQSGIWMRPKEGNIKFGNKNDYVGKSTVSYGYGDGGKFDATNSYVGNCATTGIFCVTYTFAADGNIYSTSPDNFSGSQLTIICNWNRDGVVSTCRGRGNGYTGAYSFSITPIGIINITLGTIGYWYN